tara:strand:+ start:1743 stop:2087 length:345 start_codon:yes stop_codon:yes gene_type:complete
MIKDITKEINRFVSEREWDQFHTPKNIATSISIESAELLECFQWQDPAISEVLDDAKLLESVEEEIADVMIYSLRLCSLLGSDPIEIIRSKLEKNSEKYPVSKSKGSAKKYDEL